MTLSSSWSAVPRSLRALVTGAVVAAAGSLAPRVIFAAEPPECLLPDPSKWPAPAKPYFMIAFDTSGSMSAAINPSSNNSCGYPNTRTGHGSCAVKNTVMAYSGQANFGLASYARKMSGCTAGCTGCTFANLPGNSQPTTCSNGGCGAEPNPVSGSPTRAGANILVPMLNDTTTPPAPSNVPQLIAWVDNSCAGSTELFADGCTPLNGILRDMYRYYSGSWTYPGGGVTYPSPLTSVANGERACRSVNVILVTDGDESCDNQSDAVTSAQALYGGFTKDGLAWSVKTYVINFAGGSQGNTDAIAAAGGTTKSYFATNETQLALALSNIVGGSIKPETCDNADNNCNGCTDEGFNHYCNVQPIAASCCAATTPAQRAACLASYQASITAANPQGDLAKLPCTTPAQQQTPAAWLCYDPGERCDDVDNNCVAGADEGVTKCGAPLHCPQVEACNGQDDDCDGLIDEGGVCANACTPSAEICDGCDNDCDGVTDNGIAPIPCGLPASPTVPATCAGTITCKPSQSVPVGTCAPGGGFDACDNAPQVEACDGMDEDCDGIIDDGIPSIACVPPGTPPNLDYGPGSLCQQGQTSCVDGITICSGFVGPGVEICDGIDNDCDGVVDQPNPCPADQVCKDGACLGKCLDGEFPCPGGASCVGGLCVPTATSVGPSTGAGGAASTAAGAGGAGGVLAAATTSTTGNDVGAGGAGGERGVFGLATGGGGCACTIGPRPSVADAGRWGLAALAAALLAARRRRRRLGLLAALATTALGLALTGCTTDAYCFSGCGGADADVTSTASAASGGGDLASGAGGLDCFPNCGATTGSGLCGPDEGAACNVPIAPPPGATSPCQAGVNACQDNILVCVGSIGPTSTIDGCGVDANCDGVLGNQPSLQTDVHNCGACGHDCLVGAVHATWACVAGACQFQGCQPGYHDNGAGPDLVAGDEECAYACTFASAQEACNGVDDDCDGQIDEGVIPPATTQLCGVSPAATAAECTSQVTLTCVGGAWKCAFPAGVCSPTCAATTEICDTLDNNCNGLTDENVPSIGAPCVSDAGLPAPGHGACRTTGSIICDGPSASKCSAVKDTTKVGPELCDGLDNDCDGLVDETFNAKGSNPAYFVKPAVTKIAAGTWIYSYEASRPSATGVVPGTGNGYVITAPPGATLDRTPACSVPARVPWFNVTGPEVEQTCAAMGGSICSTSEWQTACTANTSCAWGYAPRGAACVSVAMPGTKYCNLASSFDFDTTKTGDQDGLLVTGSSLLSRCFSDWSSLQGNAASSDKIYDITGNLREITRIAADQYNLLGGAFDSQNESGSSCQFTFYTVDPGFKFYDTGFRCCFSSDPTL